MQHNPVVFPTGDAHFLLSGSVGHLELKTHAPLGATGEQVGIVCHPHPLQQGTMDNKVVTTVMRAFRDLECCAVRFNYRGVGLSEGVYDEGRGECLDLLVVMTWIQKVMPQAKIHLIGFSFGAWIAFQGAVQYPAGVKSLISIAPSVQKWDLLEEWGAVGCPWQIMIGTADELVPVQEVLEWYKTVADRAGLLLLPKTGHFFHGKLLVLKAYIKQFIVLMG